MTSVPRRKVSCIATGLNLTIRRLMQSANYSSAAIAEALKFVEAHGTATDAPTVDRAEWGPVNALIRGATAHLEADPATWPDVWGEDRWAPVDDREWWARESAEAEDRRAGEDLEDRAAASAAVDALAGGLIPPDARKIKLTPRRRFRQPGEPITEADHVLTHGCV